MGDLSKELSELKVDSLIFKDVKYYISGKVHDKDGGGKRMTYMSDFVTHCITGKDAVENDVSQAEDLYEVPAVTQYWVLLSAKCKKLLPTKGFVHSGGLFSGIKACLSQLSKSDNLKVWAMISFRGGVACDVLDSSCTHLVTTKPMGNKYRVAVHHQQQHRDEEDEDSEGQRGKNGVKIVTPDWVTDSLRTGGRCQETLYHPRLLILPRPVPVPTSHVASLAKQDSQLNSPSSNLQSSLLLPLSSSSPSSTSLSQITGFAPVGSERNPSPHTGNAPNTALVYSSPSSTSNTSSSFPASTSSPAMSPSTQANRPHAISQQQSPLSTKQALEELKQRMPWNKPPTSQQQMQPLQQLQSQQQQQQQNQMQQQMLRQQQLLQQQQQQNFQVLQQRVAAARGMQIRGAIQQQHGISPTGVASSPGGQGVPRMIQGQQRVIQGVMQPQLQQQQQYQRL
ncbi:hypothetical protein J437_LFUL000466 [Ladona fulva]|uniref:BRCT domain-containing protein n=1 Tax=Ladona fulva TaxID=123851 RepID=A0A8K0PA16_LADFU|nr:hypothetical protein J437_LFUL000466 [Ladona fulva]